MLDNKKYLKNYNKKRSILDKSLEIIWITSWSKYIENLQCELEKRQILEI